MKNRIQSVDALRGFSLAGIVIVPMVENYLGGPAPAGKMEALNQGTLDGIVNGFIFLFIRGKFFALFSSYSGSASLYKWIVPHKKINILPVDSYGD